MRLVVRALLCLLLPSLCSAQVGFTTKVIPISSAQGSLLTADFNHDGYPDLLLYGASPKQSILLNDRMGGFAAPLSLPSNVNLFTAKIVDMNQDRFPDIAACASVTSSRGTFYAVVILLNDGSGNFTLGQAVTLVSSCSDIGVGDANHDGYPDIVIAGTGTAPATVIATYLGSASGKVSAPILQQVDLDDPTDDTGDGTNCALVSFQAGDLYGDGQLSLYLNTYCTVDPVDLGTWTLAHGDGTGHYTLSASTEKGGAAFRGLAFDVNQDSRPDLILNKDFSFDVGDDLEYLQNAGGADFSNSFDAGETGAQGEQYFWGVTVGDLDGDGLNDIAATLTNDFDGTESYYTPAVAIMRGSASGFTASQHWILGDDGVSDIVAADFNHDGKQDLAVLVSNSGSNGTNLYLYTNSPGVNSCAVPSQDTNVICFPANNATVGPNVPVTAASNVNDIFNGSSGALTLNRLYLDGNNVYQGTAASVSTTITASPGHHVLKLVSYEKSGSAVTTSNQFTVVAGGCMPSSGGVTICSPAANSTDSSPVTITAGAVAKSGTINAIRAYIDNVAVFTVNNPTVTNSQQVSQQVTVAAGTHHLVVLGYQSTGGEVSASADFTVSLATACYPAAAGIKICSPTNGQTGKAPVTVVAGATASTGYITAMRVYVDGVQKVEVGNDTKSKSFAFKSAISPAAGTHKVTIVAYQSTGGSLSSSESITVQ